MNLDDLKNLPTPPPVGFQPGIEWDGETGHVTVSTPGPIPKRDEIDGVLDTAPFLNSDEIEVDWSSKPRVSIHHDDTGQVRQVWYKLPLRKRLNRRFDVEDLIDMVITEPDMPTQYNPGWVHILIADTHLGKGADDGGGSEYLIEKWRTSIRKALPDERVAGINLCFGGDLIEGIVSQNGAGIAGMDLTLSEQIRVAQHMVLETVQLCLDKAATVTVASVAGNHGETTRQQNMPAGDSHDLQIVSSAEQALRFAGVGEDRVKFYYPEKNRLEVVYRAGDTTVCLIHGHKFRGQLQGAEKWWQGQAVNGRPAGAANILLAGHFHNALISNFTRDKWIMFGPALENESTWFANQTGNSSLPGILTFEMENNIPTNMKVV